MDTAQLLLQHNQLLEQMDQEAGQKSHLQLELHKAEGECSLCAAGTGGLSQATARTPQGCVCVSAVSFLLFHSTANSIPLGECIEAFGLQASMCEVEFVCVF